MKIRQDEAAIFGSAFDPVGLHHQEMARLIFRETGLPVWMMPCYDHLFTKGSRLLPARHRWNMLVQACEDWEIMQPFDWEISHQHSGSMYATMQQLVAHYPDVKLHIVIGMDNANIIEEKWVEGKSLIQEFPFIVIRREGHPATVEWFNHDPHMVLDFDHDGSSTAIREAIAEGRHDFAAQNLDPKVWEYIKSGSLYGYRDEEKTG